MWVIMSITSKIFHTFLICLFLPVFSYSQVKETHQFIQEWVQTSLLISEEESDWKTEKSTLIDLESALKKEISELEVKLEQFEKENIGAAQQRADLTKRKETVQNGSMRFYEEMQRVEKEIKLIIPLLPTPLRDDTITFLEKLDSEQENKLPLRTRLDALVSLLQSIHLFHRAVHIERQEFSLDDGKSREFRVIYFGLGVAYFVNESGTVAGWGKPSSKGWLWTRQDELAKEITHGVAMMRNQTLPRFLELPIPPPTKID